MNVHSFVAIYNINSLGIIVPQKLRFNTKRKKQFVFPLHNKTYDKDKG